MPLFKKSKSAPSNDMPGKPSLAIAMGIKRTAGKRKKMASGGMVDTAAGEKRPMPGDLHDDAMDAHQNSAKHGLSGMDWDDNTDDAAKSGSESRRSQDIDFATEPRTSIDQAASSEDEEMLDGHSTRHADELTANDESHGSLAEMVMRKRRMYAEGGMADLEGNSEEDLNNEDQMSFKAGLKEAYDLDQLDEQPEDSNEHGHVLSDEDQHDMVSAIRKRMKSRL